MSAAEINTPAKLLKEKGMFASDELYADMSKCLELDANKKCKRCNGTGRMGFKRNLPVICRCIVKFDECIVKLEAVMRAYGI